MTENNKQRLLQFSDHLDFYKLKAKSVLTDERKGYIYMTLCQLIFGYNMFQLKLTKIHFPEIYDVDAFLFWRNLVIVIIAYYSLNYKQIKILNLSTIVNKTWFFLRTIGSYFNIFFFILSLSYMRLATATCINTSYPFLIVLLSVLILKEKFYIRYLIGLILCFIGTSLIISNESAVADDTSSNNLFLGIFFGVLSVIILSLNLVASKILANETIMFENQALYMGISGVLCSTFFILIKWVFPINLIFIISGMFNGFMWYIAAYLTLEAFKLMDLSKTTPFVYLSTLTAFLLGVIFLSENIHFTDVIGGSIIIGYNIYNSIYPIKD